MNFDHELADLHMARSFWFVSMIIILYLGDQDRACGKQRCVAVGGERSSYLHVSEICQNPSVAPPHLILILATVCVKFKKFRTFIDQDSGCLSSMVWDC